MHSRPQAFSCRLVRNRQAKSVQQHCHKQPTCLNHFKKCAVRSELHAILMTGLIVTCISACDSFCAFYSWQTFLACATAMKYSLTSCGMQHASHTYGRAVVHIVLLILAVRTTGSGRDCFSQISQTCCLVSEARRPRPEAATGWPPDKEAPGGVAAPACSQSC